MDSSDASSRGMDVTEERRRAPRYEIVAGELAVLPSAMSVQILDISLGGVLLLSAQIARIGATGRLTLTLGSQPFSAEVEVRRVVPVAGTDECRIGAMFLGISPENARMIERFTDQGTS
jgi:c-di-GMP-binding flagellar brake protein YcgR